MQKTSLKISAIVLCGLLIYNSLGYFLVLSVMRVAIRHEKWSQLSTIPDEQLTSFSINKNIPDSRIKIVNQREILVNGKLYDIARKKDNGTAVTYYCKHDREEESLISKTRHFNSQAQQSPLQNKARFILDKIIKTGVFAEETNLFSNSYFILLSHSVGIHYSGPSIQIAQPPPQSCC
jgi:hypothetical protein